MTRMTRPDCAVICNLIKTHTHIEGRYPYDPTVLMYNYFFDGIEFSHKLTSKIQPVVSR